MLDKFLFIYLALNLFPIFKKDSKCWSEVSVLQLLWHFLGVHFTVVYRDLIVLCCHLAEQMWHNHLLVGGKSLVGLLSMEFLLKNLLWGIKDPLLFTKIVTERLSEHPDRTATSHPTRTVPVPLAPAMCKGKVIFYHWNVYFQIGKHCTSDFPCIKNQNRSNGNFLSIVLKNKTKQNI